MCVQNAEAMSFWTPSSVVTTSVADAPEGSVDWIRAGALVNLTSLRPTGSTDSIVAVQERRCGTI